MSVITREKIVEEWPSIATCYGLLPILHDFQLDGIFEILQGNNVLACVPTNSGKTILMISSSLMDKGIHYKVMIILKLYMNNISINLNNFYSLSPFDIFLFSLATSYSSLFYKWSIGLIFIFTTFQLYHFSHDQHFPVDW